MDARRWERVQRLFHDALEQPDEERRAFVRAACEGAPEIEAEVLALIEEDRSGKSLLDRGVEHVADAILEDPMPLPRAIGPYRLTRRLGEGGMGVVYLAERRDIDGLAAIKFLRDARLSPHRRERFEQEQRILARLNHPLICRLYDAGTLPDGTPYFVMEYVDGLPVTRFCESRKLSLTERLRLFRQVCEAVQYAHRQALIHRDLKPSNVLAVDAGPGEEPSIKLLDFGIAKQTETEDSGASMTQTGVLILTPAYAAPERLRGRPVDVATDVYSLGVLLYELLTGDLPFDLAKRTPYEAAQTVTSTDPEKPSSRAGRGGSAAGCASSVGGREWADLDVLCLTAMHREPARRYPTVEALLRDVDHYLHGRPLEARPETAGYRLGKFLRRNRRAAGAGVLGAFVIVSLVVFYTLRLSAARDEALAEAARTQRIQRFMLDLFEGGDDVAGPQKGLEVETLIERGVREAGVLGRDPAIQAELRHTLGEVYHRMSHLDRAAGLLEIALEQRRSLFGESHAAVGETMMALGLVRNDQGALEEAERLTREALAMVRAALPGEHPGTSRALAALGKVLQNRGDYPEAIRYLEEAVRLQEDRRDADALMVSLGLLANTHSYAGDYDSSDRINRRLLDLVEARLGADHPAYATCLINLGSNRRWLEYGKEAEDYYRRALVINERYHGRRHPTVASNLSLIASALTDQEKYDEARPYLFEALEVREEAFGPEHPKVALTLNQLARNYLAQGELDVAEATFLREVGIHRATRGDDHPWTATALSNLASVQFRRENWGEAESVMREALAIFEAGLKPDHVNVAIARVKLGRVLARVERYQEALEQLASGHSILAAQANPSSSWISLARTEIAAVYDALGDPARAAAFRADGAGDESADE